jgi:flagellar protein FliO/FliZ
MIMSVLFVILLFIPAEEVGAETQRPPSVNDCLEGDAVCEEETAPITENESEDEQEPIAASNDSNSLLFDLVKMFFALLLVLGLIYIMLKLLNKRNKMFNQIKHLENLGGISVGQNKSIQIIRIGSRFYVVGVGDNVEMLQEITDEKMIDQLSVQEQEKPLSLHMFLPSFLQKKSDNTTTDQDARNFKHLFSEELDKLKQNRNKLIKRNNRREDGK